jgi:uncharacterized protein YjbJ (UPF0337 family)
MDHESNSNEMLETLLKIRAILVPMSTNEEIEEGKRKQARGKIREGIGELTGDEGEKAHGQIEQAVGKMTEAVGETEKKVKKELDKRAKE